MAAATNLKLAIFFGSSSTINVIVAAKETFSGRRNSIYQNKQEALGSCC